MSLDLTVVYGAILMCVKNIPEVANPSATACMLLCTKDAGEKSRKQHLADLIS